MIIARGGAFGSFSFGLFLLLSLLLLSQQGLAVSFGCSFVANASCADTDTQRGLFRISNASADFANSHVQLMNASGYPYTLCCDTDANHTLSYSCNHANATVIVNATAASNAHVEEPNYGTYSYGVCMALSPGGLTCEYVNGSCSAGYAPMFSMANSEGSNSTNAHIGNYSTYTLNVCCQADNSPPTVPVLLYPANNNNTVFERNVTFDWADATDPDGDAITYDLNITTVTCADYLNASISGSSLTPTQELCVDEVYDWTVRACDASLCSDWASTWNFTAMSVIGITFNVNNTNFGELARNATDNTTDNTPPPFSVENSGNVPLNVTIKADDPLFDTSGLGNSSFQYKARENEASAYDSAQTAWTNVSASLTALYTNLKYQDDADAAFIDVLVDLPYDEPAGTKSSVINISGEYNG